MSKIGGPLLSGLPWLPKIERTYLEFYLYQVMDVPQIPGLRVEI